MPCRSLFKPVFLYNIQVLPIFILFTVVLQQKWLLYISNGIWLHTLSSTAMYMCKYVNTWPKECKHLKSKVGHKFVRNVFCLLQHDNFTFTGIYRPSPNLFQHDNAPEHKASSIKTVCQGWSVNTYMACTEALDLLNIFGMRQGLLACPQYYSCGWMDTNPHSHVPQFSKNTLFFILLWLTWKILVIYS